MFGGNVKVDVNKYELCVVDRFLTERNINVNAMKTKMTNVWRPAMDINMKELEPGIFLFRFYHKEDMNWVLKGGSWSFDNAMIVKVEVSNGEKLLNVPLWYVNMWMQSLSFHLILCQSLQGSIWEIFFRIPWIWR